MSRKTVHGAHSRVDDNATFGVSAEMGGYLSDVGMERPGYGLGNYTLTNEAPNAGQAGLA